MGWRQKGDMAFCREGYRYDAEAPVVFPAEQHSLMTVSVAEELQEGCSFALVLKN